MSLPPCPELTKGPPPMPEETAVAEAETKPKRQCFICDGTGEMCNICGESEAACECDNENCTTSPCKNCRGTGIAAADQAPDQPAETAQDAPGATDPDLVARYNAETVALCQDAEQAASGAAAEHSMLKAQTKAAKDVLEMREEELRRLIRERKTGLSEIERGQGLLPFTADAPTPASTEDDSWRSVGISQLGLTDRTAQLLLDAEIATVGAIADWTDTRQLVDIPNIGPKAADAISDALEKFWERRRDAALTGAVAVETNGDGHGEEAEPEPKKRGRKRATGDDQ